MPRQPEDRSRSSWKHRKYVTTQRRRCRKREIKPHRLKKIRTLPRSSDYQNITSTKNKVESGRIRQPPASSKSNEKRNDRHEEFAQKLRRQEYVPPLHPDNDGGTVGDKPREEVIEQIKQICKHLMENFEQNQESNEDGSECGSCSHDIRREKAR